MRPCAWLASAPRLGLKSFKDTATSLASDGAKRPLPLHQHCTKEGAPTSNASTPKREGVPDRRLPHSSARPQALHHRVPAPALPPRGA